MQKIVAATSQNQPQAFDDAHLYYVTDDGAEFRRVRRYEMATGRIEEVEAAPGDVDSVRFSPRGAFRMPGISANARSMVKIVDTRGERAFSFAADTATVSHDESLIAYYGESNRSPEDLFIF